MKVMHLSDLHIGKIIFEKSLIEDQKYILDQIINIVLDKKVEVVIMAGDIYDRAIPSLEAVNLLDSFLTSLINNNIKILMISGNHDSCDRLGFANSILENKGLIISSKYSGELKKVVIKNVNFYLLPFVKPIEYKHLFEGDLTYDLLLKNILEKENINYNEKNIFITHQFYTYKSDTPLLSDSEINIGGIDNIDISYLEKFDYVAMGHIHRPQKLFKDNFRYAGSPLKYSFSECNFDKSVPIIDTTDFTFELIKLNPLRDMIDIKGNLNDLLKDKSDNFIRAILTDDEELVDPISKLRKNYPNILKLEFCNKRTSNNDYSVLNKVESKSTLDLFEEFYLNQNNITLSDELRVILHEVIEEVSNEAN